MKKPKFNLGITIMTKRVNYLIEGNPKLYEEIARCIAKHHNGDWGNLDEEDKMLNDMAIKDGGRIFSSYEIGENKVKIWIITATDRSYTTILLPEEY